MLLKFILYLHSRAIPPKFRFFFVCESHERWCWWAHTMVCWRSTRKMLHFYSPSAHNELMYTTRNCLTPHSQKFQWQHERVGEEEEKAVELVRIFFLFVHTIVVAHIVCKQHIKKLLLLALPCRRVRLREAHGSRRVCNVRGRENPRQPTTMTIFIAPSSMLHTRRRDECEHDKINFFFSCYISKC